MNIRISLISFFLILCSFHLFSENSSEQQNDTLFTKAISFAEIPSEMAKTRVKTQNILNEVISYEELENVKLSNDTLLLAIQHTIYQLKNDTSTRQSIRYLENKKLQLLSQKQTTEKEITHFSSIINQLDKATSYFKKEQLKWHSTAVGMSQEQYSETMHQRISHINALLDSAIEESSQRTEEVFLIMEKGAGISVQIDELLFSMSQEVSLLEEARLNGEHLSLFNLNYSPENLEFYSAIKKYLLVAFYDIRTYVKMNRVMTYFLLILFIIMLIYFSKQKEIFTGYKDESNSHYQQKLGHIMAWPINAALILILFLSSIFLIDRPMAFKDMTNYLLILPTLVISRQLLKKHFYWYINGLVLLFISFIGLSIFPPENIFFRFDLVFMAITESFLLAHFYFRTIRKNIIKESYSPRLIKRLTVTCFTLSFIALLGAVGDKIIFSQILLQTLFYAVFSGFILYAVATLLNGLMISYLNSSSAQKINAIRLHTDVIRRRFIRIINFISFFFWIIIVLRQLSVYDIVTTKIKDFLQEQWHIGDMNFTLGNMLSFLIVIYLSVKLSRIIQEILEGDVLNKMRLNKGLPHTIAVMVRYTLVISGVVIAVNAVGIQFTNLAVIIGALGVGIGFGLQSIINNWVSGLILLFERPIQIGDTVEIGDLIGKVISIGIRSSNVRTIDGAEVIVPNSNLISNEVINWTLSDQQRRIEILLGVDYSSDPKEVIEVMKEVLKDHPLILQEPSPSIYFMEFGDFSLNFRMLFWTASYSKWMQIRSDISMKLFDELKARGINIPFPKSEIRILPQEK